MMTHVQPAILRWVYTKQGPFIQPTNQYLCIRCHKRAKTNNDVVVPIVSKKPHRSRDAEDPEVQKLCGVNWCPKEIWVKDKKMDRKWIEELEAFVCTSHVNLDLSDLLETRPVRDKCGGCGYTSSNVQLNTFWDPKTQGWLCRTCKDGRPTKPAVCQTSWCSRPVKTWRQDNNTWVRTSCKPMALSVINEQRSLRVKCEDCRKKNTASVELFSTR
jgi:hypothetical protein